MEQLNEQLLDAWLRLSTSVVNPRIVSELSYNESLVCNALFRNQLSDPDGALTATDLCACTKMLKSQMNRTLNLLESKNLIRKKRSLQDKRQVFITMNLDQADAYNTQHKQILALIDGIITHLGPEKTQELVSTLFEVADVADKLLDK